MGKHSGPEAEESAPAAEPKRLLALGAGVTVTLVAWGFLVVQAVRFGSQALDGKGVGWLFLVLAALGATACLFVMLILATRTVAVVRGMAPQRNIPRRDSSGGETPPGGRRAAR